MSRAPGHSRERPCTRRRFSSVRRGVAEVDELIDEIIRAHSGSGCGQGEGFCVCADDIPQHNWMKGVLETRGP